MRAQDGTASEPLWGIGRLQTGWLVFQWFCFLGFAAAWVMGGSDWRPGWKPTVIWLCGSVAVAALFVCIAERRSSSGTEKPGVREN